MSDFTNKCSAAPEEKVGLKELWDELKQSLAKLRRVERIRRKKREKKTNQLLQRSLQVTQRVAR